MFSPAWPLSASSMDIAQAARRLQSLAADDAKRSKTAVLRDVFPDIERAIGVGVSRAAILRELQGLGLEMSEAAFRSAVRRLRLEHAQASTRAATLEPVDSSVGALSDRMSFRASTQSGSLYDIEALSRLLRASRPAALSRWASESAAER
jgi:hypothetical protein